jgi:hypothetical protein
LSLLGLFISLAPGFVRGMLQERGRAGWRRVRDTCSNGTENHGRASSRAG